MAQRAGGAYGGLQRRQLTHLANIAIVLQEAPGRMLTFSQLMDKLEMFLHENRKANENNIRVCLSTNKCFVKVPMFPGSRDGKRNYWKFDSSHITPKMARRHFKGILEIFPELASMLEAERAAGRQQRGADARAPQAAAARPAVKFDGPFSVESLLKKDDDALVRHDGAAGRSLAWDLRESPGRIEQIPAQYPMMAVSRMHAYTAAFPAPHFNHPHHGYVTFRAPTSFARDNWLFGL